MTYALAVDIGGTFTDAVLRRDDGALFVDKTLTTHEDLLEGLFRCLELVLMKAGGRPVDVTDIVVHATTIVTNALIERKGAKTALLVTRGFRDILSIRNEHRYEMYDPQIEFAEPLVPRDLTFMINERTLADGERLRPVSEDEVAALAEALAAAGVASVAISFLNSFRNSANEQAAARILRAKLPRVSVSLSSQVAPQIREYPRTATTVVNAYTAPITEPYLAGLAQGLKRRGIEHEPLIMLSSGGVIGAGIAARNPVRMIESGPAAGALAAAHFAARLGLERLMSFDMGGTTAKACLIEGGKPLVAGSFEIDRVYRFKEGSGIPITVPSIDMIEVGAGGGSIASVDDLGLLKVGPRSAGSMPGPACYGRGGSEATVTDADLVLGLLDADNFLGGDMRLDKAAAADAVGRISGTLGTGVPQTAAGIFRIVAETMAAAARAHAIDRGIDYRGLPLLAFGGAGPAHACAVGTLLQSTRVIFPPRASVLSALGTLVTPVRFDLVRSAVAQLDALDWDTVISVLDELSAEGIAALSAAGTAREAVRLGYGADLRYMGQQNEVGIELDIDPRRMRDASRIREAFERAYAAQYGVNPSHVPVEIVSWRVRAEGARRDIAPADRPPQRTAAPKSERRVALWPAANAVPVFDRASLGLGQVIVGPAIVEERETTTVLPPGWTTTLDAIGCLVATRTDG